MVQKPNSAPSTFEENITLRSVRWAAWPISLLFDRLGNVSRHRLLFAVVLADGVSIFAAWAVARGLLGARPAPTWTNFAAILAIALLTVTALRAQWSYTIPSLRRCWMQLVKVFTSIGLVTLAASGVVFLFGISSVTADEMAAGMGLSALFLCCVRLVAAEYVQRLTRAGRLVRRTVIVGAGKDAEHLIRQLRTDPESHLRILGIFDDRCGDRAEGDFGGIVRLGTFEDLADFCRKSGVDLLIVTVPAWAEARLMEILGRLFALQADVRISALNSKLRLNSRSYSFIGRVPMLAVMDKPLSDWDCVLKNLEDRLIGSLLLLVALPLMAVIAAAIRWETKGPIFFRQKRYGFNNELIEVMKFRSMYVDQQDEAASKLVTRNDPRVTRVGAFIRRMSLDELPQLINVVKGEMSLVGPRPHATGARADRDLYENVVQGYFARHRMKPGVTGWAQINGWRGETDTREKLVQRVEHDLYYIDHWSVFWDLYILAMTPFSLLSGKNAY